METPCWASPQTSSEVRGCAVLSAAERVRAEASILEEVMRYQFNFEAEPFAAYPELEKQYASQPRMDSAFDQDFSAPPGQTDAGPGGAPGGYRLRLPHAGV